MNAGTIGEYIVVAGILVVAIAIGGLATGQSAPVDLEVVSWAGAAVAFAGAAVAMIGS